MTYQILANKWRPQNFNQVIGQKHILTALKNSLKTKKLHHTYLFSGTRGVGKTSIARIFSKGLNCEKEITEFPCNKCKHCIEITKGISMDLIEVDAASKTKVEDIRILIENIQYTTSSSRFKIYLIDEIHMLSRYSFNALLKTLEEPPSHVKFIFATTHPQKIPETILSRCIHFYLEEINEKCISKHINYILEKEKIPNDLSACQLIAKISNGSIRDSLSLLDKIIAMNNYTVYLNDVKKNLKIIDTKKAIKILEYIVINKPIEILNIIENIFYSGNDLENIFILILSVIHEIMMIKISPDYIKHINIKNSEKLYKLSRFISKNDLQYYYKIIIEGRKNLIYAPNKRIGIEMTLIKLILYNKKIKYKR